MDNSYKDFQEYHLHNISQGSISGLASPSMKRILGWLRSQKMLKGNLTKLEVEWTESSEIQ